MMLLLQPPPVSHAFLNVSNLPVYVPRHVVRQRIEQIAENCGGKLIQHTGNRGILRFSTPELAQR